MEELFNKTVTVSIRKADREERIQSIGLSLLTNITNTPVHRKDLILRLTDETDPFFLYTLTISEEDFQTLRSQQGLLVDFACFPQKLIDLFELCIVGSSKERPKFCLQLYLSSMTSKDIVPCLQVIETNQFRHLTHISLKLVSASDSYLKKYLAQTILTLKESNELLTVQLSRTKSDLTNQLLSAEESLKSRNKELDRMKSDWSSEITAINNNHSAILNKEKERAMETQFELQSKLDTVKSEQEMVYHKRIEVLDDKIKTLDKTNKELTDHKYRCEAAIRELKAKVKGTEEERTGIHEELIKLRKDNTTIESQLHYKEKNINQLQTRVAVLEQEIKDKTMIISRTSQLLEKANELKESHEVQFEQTHRQIVKLETAFKQSTQEVSKGNEIIARLQSDIKGLKSKLKLRNSVITQQEKIINGKELELTKLSNELKSLNNDLVKNGAESDTMRAKIEQLEAQKQQLQEDLKTSENVVTWLNKQVNDQMLTRSHRITAPPLHSSSSIKTDPPLSVIRGPPYSIGSWPHYSSTPITGSNDPGPNTPTGPSSDDRTVLRPLQQQTIPNEYQKVLFKPPSRPLATPPSSSVTTPTTSSPNEPYIDPKYLPPDQPAGIKENSPLLTSYLPK